MQARAPPLLKLLSVINHSKIDAIDDMLTNREEVFQSIRKRLLKAQTKMKQFADVKRCEVSYEVGD